jgi:alkylhydroperoxidase family enzyme
VPRLPLLPEDPDDPVLAALFSAFREEGRAPIWLYRTLAHAPRALRGFSAAGRALRGEASAPRALRELAIMRTAQLTASAYEWSHHRPMALRAGVREEQLVALAEWRAGECFDARERAVLRCADEVHAAALTDEAFAELQRRFPPDQVVELVMTAAFYQAVARVLQAFAVEVEPAYQRYLDQPGWASDRPGM